MDEPVAEEPVAPDEVPKGPVITINRRFFRNLGLRGTKNPTPRSGFLGPGGRPRLTLSHTKKKEDGEVDAT